jgi:glycosyltransferase involved in cell wall biosynthesis
MSGQTAALVVRNTASYDARVLRCARKLRSLGYEAVVIAVTSEEETTKHAVAQGVPIVRLTPRVPLAGARRLLTRRTSGGSTTQAQSAPGDAASGPPTRRNGLLARAYRLLRTLSYYRQGIAALRALQPRLVHCNDYNTMWIGVAAKLLIGSRLVYDSHELWPDRNGRSEPRWWLLTCEALFLRVADGTLATSPGHAETISRRHRVAAPLVVRNVVERQSVNGTSAAADGESDGDGHTIAYVGAITGSRGLEPAIDALARTEAIELRAIGPGSPAYRERLAARAAEQGVAERVRFEVPVPPQQVSREAASAAAGLALIQPSCLSYELSLPNKLFEYLAAGLPILAADVPVIRQFVERTGAGLVVPPDDRAAIAAAMMAIVAPRRNRELRAAARAAARDLSWEREAEGLARAYRAAMATRERRR